MHEIILFVISIGAGFLGAILGVGGGLIVVPALTLFFHVDIRYAIAASLISIIATSSGAAASFLKDHLTNVKVAIFLEVGTVFGAITGFLIASYVQSSVLYFIFSGFLIFSIVMTARKRESTEATADHPWSQKLGLAGSYKDTDGIYKHYEIANVRWGLFFMYFAGILSALLGIGSGILKVLAMDGAMKLPIKVSLATSNFMIGVTAAASAGAFLIRGDIRPEIAGPVALGIIFGSWFGARAMVKMNPVIIRRIFIVFLLVVSVQMIIKGFNQ
ncbi:MAG: sulfite exporter TauE/SafE family protein [Bdellovibrio sp.]|nr:sulfite exporter TauE/SafE family protein [Bdellovibrio sp.]